MRYEKQLFSIMIVSSLAMLLTRRKEMATPTLSLLYSTTKPGTTTENKSSTSKPNITMDIDITPTVSETNEHLDGVLPAGGIVMDDSNITRFTKSSFEIEIKRHPCGTVLDPDNWQIVLPNTSYVYAAHLDPDSDHLGSVIMIIGILSDRAFSRHGSHKDNFYCQVWIESSDGHDVRSYLSKIDDVINQGRDEKYANVQYKCSIKISSFQMTNAVVSLLHVTQIKPDATPSNCMRLRHKFKEGVKYNYTVCLGGPIRGAISPRWFVEWMELNRLFGAQAIMVHSMNESHELDRYIEYYKQTDLLIVQPWTLLPGMVGSRFAPFFQHTAMTDCLFRMRRWTTYIVQVDMDELIVPRHPEDWTWADMIRRTNCTSDVKSYAARHMFYGLKYPTNRINQLKTPLLTSNTVQRSTEIPQHKERGKYIANSFIATNLHTHTAFGDGKTCVLDTNIGGNHHYRMKVLSRKDKMIDDRMTKYTNALAQRVYISLYACRNKSDNAH